MGERGKKGFDYPQYYSVAWKWEPKLIDTA